MNTDIRISISFPDHPKTVKLEKKLGPQGPLSLIYLWIFASQRRPSGVLDGMDEDDIAIAAKWPKASKQFIDALISVKFISCDKGTYTIHDWKENNPYAAHATQRAEKAKKAAQARWSYKQDDKCSEQDQALPLAQNSNAPSPAPYPSPDPIPKELKAGPATVDNSDHEDPGFSIGDPQ